MNERVQERRESMRKARKLALLVSIIFLFATVFPVGVFAQVTGTGGIGAATAPTGTGGGTGAGAGAGAGAGTGAAGAASTN